MVNGVTGRLYCHSVPGAWEYVIPNTHSSEGL